MFVTKVVLFISVFYLHAFLFTSSYSSLFIVNECQDTAVVFLMVKASFI